MTWLGDFGEERPALDDVEFGWLGETFRINPDASDIGFMEFMAQAAEVTMPEDLDMDDPGQVIAVMNRMTEATTAMHRFIRGQIHPQDWDRFLTHAKAKHQQTSDLMRLSHNLTAAISRFPTGQPSDSAATPPSTSRRSSGGSSLAARQAQSAGDLDRMRERAQQRRGAPAPPATPPATPAAQRRHQVAGQAMKLLPKRPDLRLLLLEQQWAQDAAEEQAQAQAVSA